MGQLVPSASQSRSMMLAVMLAAVLASQSTANAAGQSLSETLSSQTIWDIARYCQACWKNARLPVDHWEDCTQQVLARLLERVSLPGWAKLLKDEGDERKEFFRAIDTVKKRSQRAKNHVEVTPEVADRHELAARETSQQWAEVAEVSRAVLTPRQQRILELSREGYSVLEIATELSMTAERVSDEKYKAIRKLRQEFGTESNA